MIIRHLQEKAWGLVNGIFINIYGRAGATAQLVEHLPIMHEDLGCDSSTA